MCHASSAELPLGVAGGGHQHTAGLVSPAEQDLARATIYIYICVCVCMYVYVYIYISHDSCISSFIVVFVIIMIQ